MSYSLPVLRIVLLPLMSVLLMAYRILSLSIRRIYCFDKTEINQSLVFIANNSSSLNVLSSLAKSLSLRACEHNIRSCVIDASELHRFKFAGCKLVYMHWAISCYVLFFCRNNTNILWYSHTRLNVFPYIPFFRYMDRIFFQNSLDASLVRSHEVLANYHIFPGIVYDYPNYANKQLLKGEWESRPYDICFYLAMNSSSPSQYYNIRKNITYSIELARELSKYFSVNILLNHNAYIYFENTVVDKDLNIEIRQSFPENLAQLSSARYFINSSLLEGGPISIIESIFAGCLPISSLYSMASSIPEISSLGLLFDINKSPLQAAVCIKSLILRKLPYDEVFKKLSSAASSLTETAFVKLLDSI